MSVERREGEEEEAAMSGEVSRAFAEKREAVRRLQDDEVREMQWMGQRG